jgi:peptidoglycan/LPS O-acetylase OafA/YrhL
VKRSQALDSVRGIAILLVVIWHYVPRDDATPGLILFSSRLFWSGVDMFFVLSGFLIGSILLHNIYSKNYFSTFYIRRAARILPLYLLVVSAFALLIHLQPEFLAKTLKRHLPLWSYLTFTQNFMYAAKGNLNDPFIDVTWSLAIEEQFYIFLSLLVRNLNKRKLLIAAIGLIILAPILRFFAPNFLVAYLLPFHRADSLMLGVLLALVWQWAKGKEFLHRHAGIFRWSCLFLFLGAVFLNFQKTFMGDPAGHFWLALLFCNFIVLALVQNDRAGRFHLFNNKVLGWLGLRSYGIYLFHKPIQILTPFLLAYFLSDRLSTWTVIAIYTLVLIVVSELSYRLLEKPIMVWGHRFKYDPVEKRQEEVTQPQPV